MSLPRIAIRYCRQCRFVLRAGWMAQELLFTFDDAVGEVALVPGGGGEFAVSVDDQVVFDKQVEGRFPESKELKQRIRDVISPERDLGHSDRP